jgi:hypothetical protein
MGTMKSHDAVTTVDGKGFLENFQDTRLNMNDCNGACIAGMLCLPLRVNQLLSATNLPS